MKQLFFYENRRGDIATFTLKHTHSMLLLSVSINNIYNHVLVW